MNNDTSRDPRIPPREEVVLRYVLEAKAEAHPEKVFMVDAGGSSWTYADLLAKTRAVALRRRHAAGPTTRREEAFHPG